MPSFEVPVPKPKKNHSDFICVCAFRLLQKFYKFQKFDRIIASNKLSLNAKKEPKLFSLCDSMLANCLATVCHVSCDVN